MQANSTRAYNLVEKNEYRLNKLGLEIMIYFDWYNARKNEVTSLYMTRKQSNFNLDKIRIGILEDEMINDERQTRHWRHPAEIMHCLILWEPRQQIAYIGRFAEM